MIRFGCQGLILVFALMGAVEARAGGVPSGSTLPKGLAAERLGTLALARGAVESRHFQIALNHYGQVLAGNPADVDLLIEVARVNGFADHNAEAARLYRLALTVAPSRRYDILPSLAWQTLWAGAPAEALQLFRELTANEFDRAGSSEGEGQSLQALGHLEGASSAYRRALQQKPGQPELVRRLARVLMWQERHDESVLLLTSHLASNPADRDSAWLLGTALNMGGRHRRAIEQFARLGRPHGAAEQIDLARAYRWSGFDDFAFQWLEGAADDESVWLRDWRVNRERRQGLRASFDHSIDRDRLESFDWRVASTWPSLVGVNAELEARRVALRDGFGETALTQLRGQLRWRIGNPADASTGLLMPQLQVQGTQSSGWSPLVGAASLSWRPRDLWRVDARLGRELIETPMAIHNRIVADALSIGVEHRVSTVWTLAGTAAALRFSDGNVRHRVNATLATVVAVRPRLEVGGEVTYFRSETPTGPLKPALGYWNPGRYGEARFFTQLTWEARPFDVALRLGLGQAREVDGWGAAVRGRPNFWALDVGYDASPEMRMTLALGGSGANFGPAQSGPGYWRRHAGFNLSAWF